MWTRVGRPTSMRCHHHHHHQRVRQAPLDPSFTKQGVLFTATLESAGLRYMDASRWLSCSLFGQQRSFCGPPGLRRLRVVPFNPLSLQRTKEFFTNNWQYTFTDAPGYTDFIKNMITDALQENTTHIMVPANGNLTTRKSSSRTNCTTPSSRHQGTGISSRT